MDPNFQGRGGRPGTFFIKRPLVTFACCIVYSTFKSYCRMSLWCKHVSTCGNKLKTGSHSLRVRKLWRRFLSYLDTKKYRSTRLRASFGKQKDPMRFLLGDEVKFFTSATAFRVVSNEKHVIRPHFLNRNVRINIEEYTDILDTFVVPWMIDVAVERICHPQ